MTSGGVSLRPGFPKPALLVSTYDVSYSVDVDYSEVGLLTNTFSEIARAGPVLWLAYLPHSSVQNFIVSLSYGLTNAILNT